MLQLPEDFITQMKADLGAESELFFESLLNEPATSIRYNPMKASDSVTYYENTEAVAWAKNAVYLEKRPSFTFDPYFQAGHYYVQEASSMFLAEVLKQHVDLDNSLTVLDLCAAPGGKSTHLLSLISNDSLLISNEVIATRASILVENISRWGNSNVVVTNNDPEHFHALANCLDLVVIDAPCSGEGMFRKDHDSINEWNLNNVAVCSARQKRILHTAAALVKAEGILIYSTCTFNTKEDVNPILDLLKDDDWESLQINIAEFPSITERIVKNNKSFYGYHFYPHKTKGEGFYISVLRKKNAEAGKWPKVMKNVNFADRKTKQVIANYINTEGLDFIQHNQQSLAFPISLKNELLGLLNTSLRIKKFGVDLGQIIRDELIPDQALAMSNIPLIKFEELSLSKEEAIQYLQKKEFNVDVNSKGWHIVKYNGASLGFAKLMGNRMNNTYPKEWRIRSEQ